MDNWLTTAQWAGEECPPRDTIKFLIIPLLLYVHVLFYLIILFFVRTRSILKTSPDKMKEIIAMLENDKRYIDLECLEEERDEVIENFIEELYRRGPPPPPTATEPNRLRR